jgi:hypothetical protein
MQGVYGGACSMTRSRYVYKNVRSVSPHIKLAVFEEAVRREVTMSDVVGSVLGERFGVPYVLSGEKSIGVDLDGDQFRIRIPSALGQKIWRESRKTGETESSVVLGTIAAHFDLLHEPVKKGRRRVVA